MSDKKPKRLTEKDQIGRGAAKKATATVRARRERMDAIARQISAQSAPGQGDIKKAKKPKRNQ